MQIHSVGIDLGKTTFHLLALSAAGTVLLRKKFTQNRLITFTANLQVSLIGMETCAGAHFLSRTLREQGHDVKLIPAQFVRPFVKSNKNDFLDAEAIAEAVDRQNMRFVPIKIYDWFLVLPHYNPHRCVGHRNSKTTDYGKGMTHVSFGKGLPLAVQPVMPTLRQITEAVTGAIDGIEKVFLALTRRVEDIPNAS